MHVQGFIGFMSFWGTAFVLEEVGHSIHFWDVTMHHTTFMNKYKYMTIQIFTLKSKGCLHYLPRHTSTSCSSELSNFCCCCFSCFSARLLSATAQKVQSVCAVPCLPVMFPVSVITSICMSLSPLQ